MTPWRRAPRTALLTATVLVLLPLLAVLQYHWLSQIGDETATRLRVIVSSAAIAMSTDLAFESGRAWRERVADADPADDRRDVVPLVVDALVVDKLEAGEAAPRVRAWNIDRHACEPAIWPEAYGALQPDQRHLVEFLQRRSSALGIVPVVREPGAVETPVRPPCEMSGPWVVVFRLDPAVLRNTLVPEVVRRHFDALQLDDFRVAVVTGAARHEVVYAPPGVDAPAVAARPDVAVPLTLAGGDRRGRGGRGIGGGRSGLRAMADADPRVAATRRGHVDADDGWVLVAQHRVGSLEQAVARLRARNLAVSFGIFLLLGVAVVLIGVNARKAERLGRQQVEFVAAVSHEMRTPVTAIELAARNLEDGLVTDAAGVRRYGAVVRAEAVRLRDTVERVLQFAALEAGRRFGPLGDVDVRDVVEGVVLAARSGHAEARIEFEAADGPITAHTDPSALRSIVQNLLGNALKYGGAPPWALVRVERAGQAAEVRVTVEDHGPGIDADDEPHVFEPFYRGRLAVDRRLPGNGLGLHIVKRCTEALGGRVTLKTGRGTGTSFTVHLPQARGVSADHGATTTPAARRG